jgi:hypothetical protein
LNRDMLDLRHRSTCCQAGLGKPRAGDPVVHEAGRLSPGGFAGLVYVRSVRLASHVPSAYDLPGLMPRRQAAAGGNTRGFRLRIFDNTAEGAVY